MKILAPIVASTDIDILNPNLYNTEFFCGYLPQWWINEYNSSENKSGNLATPINNRNGKGSNVHSFEELCTIVKKAYEYNTNVFLVLNAKYYPEYIYESMRRYLDEVIDAGIKRIIVCDLGMIAFLEENYPNIKISVSCLNQITNSMAVGFYSNFKNVDRIVFPRHMSSEEIEKIIVKYPNMEFEYFIFSNKCLYDDGYCRGIHEFTPICKDLYYADFYSNNEKLLDDYEQNNLRMKEYEFSTWTRNELEPAIKGYCTANFACSACSLVKLKKYNNIVSVKLSIRGHDIKERLRQVEIASFVLKYLDDGNDVSNVQHIVSSMYGKEDLCTSGKACMMN